MTDRYILDLSSPESRSELRCGEKGADLAVLAGEAFPVPEGFVVTTDAFSSFLAKPGLSSIHRKLQTADSDRSIALVEELRQQILATDLPRRLEEEVSRTLDLYQNGSPAFWAVRSSPAAAGTELRRDTRCYDTVLGVSTAEVGAAIRQVWSSAFTERAARCRRELKSLEVRMAVVVQKLLRAEAAGICCTVDPLRPKDRMFVFANYGLGESVVGATVMPDTHVVDRQSLQSIMDVMGSKTMQIVARAGGIAETGVRGDKQKRFCLSPTQVGCIAKLAMAVEAQQGKPVGIEWAYEDETLYLLAARPITASSE